MRRCTAVLSLLFMLMALTGCEKDAEIVIEGQVKLERSAKGDILTCRGLPFTEAGDVVRGEPAVADETLVWIQEEDGIATLHRFIRFVTTPLAEGPAGALLFPAPVNDWKVAWSEFLGDDWQIAIWNGNGTLYYGSPDADDILPVAGPEGVAWIESWAMDVFAWLLPEGEAEPVRLPGEFVRDLEYADGAFRWKAREGGRWVEWTWKDGKTQSAPVEEPPRPASPAERDFAVTSSETGELPSPTPTITWSRIPTDRAPLPRTTHGQALLDEGRLLVFGGEIWDPTQEALVGLDAETWILDTGATAWREVVAATGPTPRAHTPIACDPTRRQCLIWGVAGENETGDALVLLEDTWIFHADEERWEKIDVLTAPAPSSGVGLVYDPNGDRYLLYRHGELWAYYPEKRRWRLQSTGPGPAPRNSSALVLDTVGNQLLLFGGALHPYYFDDTWILDLDRMTWREVRKWPHPAARSRPALGYHPFRRQAVLYGGVRGPFSHRFNDLWAFDFEKERWMFLGANFKNAPNPRGGFMNMPWDRDRDAFLLFGGRSGVHAYHDDTWELRVGGGESE